MTPQEEEDLRLHPYADASIRPEGFQLDPLHPVPDATIRPGVTVSPTSVGQTNASSAPTLPPLPAATPAAGPSGTILDDKTTASTTSSLSKPQIEDFKALDKIREKEQTDQDKLTELNRKDAEKTSRAANDAAVQAQQAAAAKAAAIEEAQRRRVAAEATYQSKLDEFNKQEFHSFFSSRPQAAEVLTDLGVAAGAFGASGRGQNESMEILKNRVQNDFDIQRSNIERKKDSVVMARAGVADADQARQILLDDVDVKNAAALSAIQARLVASKMANGMDRATAEGEVTKTGIAQKIQELKEKTTDGMTNRSVTTNKYINPDAEELKASARAAAKPGQDLSIYDPETGNLVGRGRNARDVTMATKTLESAQKARAAVIALQTFHEANPGRVLPNSNEADQLAGLRKDVVNAFASLYGNGGSDVKMKGDALRLPREGDLFASQKHEPQIKQLMDTIDSVKSGVLRSRGIQPPEGGADEGKAPGAKPALSAADITYLKAVKVSKTSSAEDKAKATALLGGA